MPSTSPGSALPRPPSPAPPPPAQQAEVLSPFRWAGGTESRELAWALKQDLAEGRATARRYIDAPALTAHHQLGPHIAARPRYFADRSGRGRDEWVAFAATRLRPGHIFIVVRSDALFPSGLAGHLRASGAARLIETGNQIDVWQWPLDAPAPDTPRLQEYVARHYQEPDGG